MQVLAFLTTHTICRKQILAHRWLGLSSNFASSLKSSTMRSRWILHAIARTPVPRIRTAILGLLGWFWCRWFQVQESTRVPGASSGEPVDTNLIHSSSSDVIINWSLHPLCNSPHCFSTHILYTEHVQEFSSSQRMRENHLTNNVFLRRRKASKTRISNPKNWISSSGSLWTQISKDVLDRSTISTASFSNQHDPQKPKSNTNQWEPQISDSLKSEPLIPKRFWVSIVASNHSAIQSNEINKALKSKPKDPPLRS